MKTKFEKTDSKKTEFRNITFEKRNFKNFKFENTKSNPTGPIREKKRQLEKKKTDSKKFVQTNL